MPRRPLRALRAVLACLAALACLAPATPADAQYFGRNKVQFDDFDFQELATDHFRLLYYPPEEQAIRDAARMAERWYERHSQVFLHTFDERKPLIFYANDADFQQTNVIDRRISPATGGFTEPRLERVVMPLSASYGETHHVLGHELVHSFQYDLALSGGRGFQLRAVPLWMVEGMAEYLSLGRYHTHTAMWMRDAALRDDLPSATDLANSAAYFPYRFGHAFMAYVGGKYGDRAVADLYKTTGRTGDLDQAFQALFALSADSLAAEWGRATKQAYLPLAEGRTPADAAGRKVLALDKDAGTINIGPRLSPDGRYVAFISERDIFTFNLFVADAQTGEVIAEVDQTGLNPHFNALRFLNAAGAWSPDGRRLAFISFEDGDNQVTIWDVDDEAVVESFMIEGVTAMKNVAWGPEGRRIAVSGTSGGLSDLYVLDLETEDVRQLTRDRYADLQPAWSPDGSTIAFTTDRGGTDLATLSPTLDMRLGFVDVATGEVTTRQPFPGALHHNPQYAPDGQSLYFISDQDGFRDVYRLNLDTGARFRVTRLQTGVSGITGLAPAMSVARQAGDVLFSVFEDGEYTGFALPAEEAQGTPVQTSDDTASVDDTASAGATAPGTPEARARLRLASLAPPPPDAPAAQNADTRDAATRDARALRTDALRADALRADLARPDTTTRDTTTRDTTTRDTTEAAPDTTYAGRDTTGATMSRPAAGVLPPNIPADESLIATNLRAPSAGLPPDTTYRAEDYDAGLRLTGIAPPSVGVSAGGPLGTQVAGGAAFQFGDLLGNQQLTVRVQAQGRIQDIGGQVTYLNQKNRLNWGASAGHIPRVFVQAAFGPEGETVNRVIQRIVVDQALGLTRYPLGPTQRLEVSAGAVRYGFDADVQTFDATTGRRVDDDLSADELGLFQPGDEYFGIGEAAYVLDFARFGLTSPVQGGRARLSVSPRVGTTSFVTARADARRYVFVKPFTFAFQALHVGNYGADVQDLFGTESIGFPYSLGFVRGYNLRSFDPEACGANLATCPAVNQLVGTRKAKASIEVRLPLLGPERLALIPFRYVPTELTLFTDAGLAWTGDEAPSLTWTTDPDPGQRVPVVSAGVATRHNILGAFVLELYYAQPFQRPEAGGQFGLRFLPGW